MARHLTLDPGAFSTIAYGRPSSNMMDRMHSEYERAKNTLCEMGHEYLQVAQDAYDLYIRSGTQRIADAAYNMINNCWETNTVRTMSSLSMLQNAPVAMTPYLLAEPTYRKLVQDGRADGWSHVDYVDPTPDDIGENHREYQMVVDGIVEVTDDGWTSTNYSSSEDDLFEELTFEQQLTCMDAWELIRHQTSMGHDVGSLKDVDL